MIDFRTFKADGHGLVPAIVQDDSTGEVLMVAWMNDQSWRETLRTRRTHFWSRSRRELWEKGASSGNTQEVVSAAVDCDADVILLRVRPAGPACHTGARTCFFTPVLVPHAPPGDGLGRGPGALAALEQRILERKRCPDPGSYTTYLFEKGLDKMLKKLGEESTEVVIAAKNGVREQVVAESADLLYHWLVMLAERDIPLAEVCGELSRRHGQKRRPLPEDSESTSPPPRTPRRGKSGTHPPRASRRPA